MFLSEPAINWRQAYKYAYKIRRQLYFKFRRSQLKLSWKNSNCVFENGLKQDKQ